MDRSCTKKLATLTKFWSLLSAFRRCRWENKRRAIDRWESKRAHPSYTNQRIINSKSTARHKQTMIKANEDKNSAQSHQNNWNGQNNGSMIRNTPCSRVKLHSQTTRSPGKTANPWRSSLSTLRLLIRPRMLKSTRCFWYFYLNRAKDKQTVIEL